MKIHMHHLLAVAGLFFIVSSCKVADVKSTSRPVTHEQWDSLLKKHVTSDGFVDYTGFQRDSNRLNEYLERLGNHHPNEQYWNKNERLAYWINAYNAFTVKLVADHYPVSSIKEIKSGIPFVNTVWDIKFIKIEGREYDLNNIEHGILRPKFEEPRIHFAVNCASISCPPLWNRAYTADNLNDQLDRAATRFLDDQSRNQFISENRAELSKIFSWFKGDFTKGQSLIAYINQYAPIQLKKDASISYLDYDWGLNHSDAVE